MDIFQESKKRYGSPKITKILKSKGYKVSQKRVSRRMKKLGISSIITKKRKPCSASKKKVDDNNKFNLLNQEFKANRPGTKWVADITYIYTKDKGWTYLATILDLFDLSLIGYSYSTSMNSNLVVNSLKNAISRRKPLSNLLVHTDLGSQYTSNAFEGLLKELNIKHSYSKKGYPYDNAPMESFNSILKKELIYTQEPLTFEDTKTCLFEFIESWYNRTRIHGSLDYVSPYVYYHNYLNNISVKYAI